MLNGIVNKGPEASRLSLKIFSVTKRQIFCPSPLSGDSVAPSY